MAVVDNAERDVVVLVGVPLEGEGGELGKVGWEEGNDLRCLRWGVGPRGRLGHVDEGWMGWLRHVECLLGLSEGRRQRGSREGGGSS